MFGEMYEQDYIMRIIHEIVRTLLRLLFNIDTDALTADILQNEEKRTLDEFTRMIDGGDINGAENRLYEIESGDYMNDLKVALLFYEHLNSKSNDFLEAHDFSREEIKLGLRDILEKYGLGDMTAMFLSER